MLAALTSPCRIKQSHRRRRRIVSGRRQYNYLRDYDSSTGRYIESDPIGILGGVGTYAYSQDAPMELFDEFGACPGSKCGVVGSPQYNRNGRLITDGTLDVTFNWNVTFRSDGIYRPSCCTAKEEVRSDKYLGFGTSNGWQEDHDHQGGTYTQTSSGFSGTDTPVRLHGSYTTLSFRFQVFDNCNNNDAVYTSHVFSILFL